MQLFKRMRQLDGNQHGTNTVIHFKVKRQDAQEYVEETTDPVKTFSFASTFRWRTYRKHMTRTASAWEGELGAWGTRVEGRLPFHSAVFLIF